MKTSRYANLAASDFSDRLAGKWAIKLDFLVSKVLLGLYCPYKDRGPEL